MVLKSLFVFELVYCLFLSELKNFVYREKFEYKVMFGLSDVIQLS